MKKALILIDLQNDFMPGGALAVNGGDQIVPLANQLMPFFDLVIATQDFHPKNHQSFASQHAGKKPGDIIKLGDINQILWPNHCIQNEYGSHLVDALNIKKINKIFHKGTNPLIDSYSAFFDNQLLQSTELDIYLKTNQVQKVYLLGLATDYCVKFSALDACMLGFKTYLIADACRAVELQPGDTQKAIGEMKASGVQIITSDVILTAGQFYDSKTRSTFT